eukprot:6188151-Pleurochrysis_carterae.AAC.1
MHEGKHRGFATRNAPFNGLPFAEAMRFAACLDVLKYDRRCYYSIAENVKLASVIICYHRCVESAL